MSYKLFDIKGNEINHHNLQDKSVWCKQGERLEEAFVRMYGTQLGVAINPEKTTNPYAPDLINLKNGKLGDLKLQSTPFFKSQSMYRIDPTYAVVFNLKDKERYSKHYPDLEIYYFVNWLAVAFEMGSSRIEVNPINGVWMTDFKALNNLLENSTLHQYQQRVFDQKGNAKSSFVIDIRDSIFRKLI